MGILCSSAPVSIAATIRMTRSCTRILASPPRLRIGSPTARASTAWKGRPLIARIPSSSPTIASAAIAGSPITSGCATSKSSLARGSSTSRACPSRSTREAARPSARSRCLDEEAAGRPRRLEWATALEGSPPGCETVLCSTPRSNTAVAGSLAGGAERTESAVPEFDVAIRGGTVVTASDTSRADIGIRAGRIAAVAEKVEGAGREIDASGLLVMPGGIDSHVHFAQPAGPDIKPADDFASGTAAAAAGGNTCVLPFALQVKGTSLRECVEEYRRKAEGQCYIDVGFHLIITQPTPEVLGQELPALIKAGHTSFKVFMTYDDLVLNDRELLEVFEVARRERALVMVHAEGYDAIRFMTERLERAAKTEPFFHAASRPQVVEREATHRAISHAELVDVPIMIVHVSGREAMEQIRWARQRGLKVYAETCPQYITLTEDDLRGTGMDMSGAKYVCSPPPRDRESHRAIGKALSRECSRPSPPTIPRSATTIRRASSRPRG